MRKAPNLWTLRNLVDHINSGCQSVDKDGKWYPARPIGFFSSWYRLKLAWGVLTGKYDVLKWPGNQ